MKKLLTLGIGSLVLLTSVALANPQGFGPANAQVQGFNGPSQANTTVALVKQNAYDDQIVVLKGRLVQYYGDNWYVFKDEKGNQIDVELDDDRPWYNIKKDQLIIIVAEVDRDYQRVTLDVKDAQPIKNL